MGWSREVAAGGQTWIHRIRMLKQVFKLASFLALSICAVVWIHKMSMIPEKHYYASLYYLKAFGSQLLSIKQIKVNPAIFQKYFYYFTNSENIVSTSKVLSLTGPYFHSTLEQATLNFNQLSGIFTFSNIAVLFFFLVRGKLQNRKRHVEGKKIVSPWRLNFKLRIRRKHSDLKIGKNHLLKNAETKHLLVSGGTGSGKTNFLKSFLKQIRARGDRAIIIDTTDVLKKNFFHTETDLLLNPNHDNSQAWSPWAEGADKVCYDAIAESLIPTSYNDNENYWRTAARNVLTSLLDKLSDTEKSSELLDWILYRPMSELCEIVQGTKAAAHIDPSSEKTAASIRSLTAAHISSLELLKDTSNPFSIKKWVKNQNNGWLFLSCNPDERASLTPLFSCWISTAIQGLLSLEPNSNQRLWFILDELPSMGKIKDLDRLVTEGRKYGGCGVLSLQSPDQLEEIYGRHTTSTILSNCLTKLVFCEQNPQTAEKISKIFGSKEVLEVNEGISYGANDIRDGVSLNSQKRSIPVVSPNQIQTLKPNHGYLNIPGNYPVAKIAILIQKS